MPLMPLTDGWAVVVSVVAWTVIGVGVGYWAHRRPVASFETDSWLTRLRPFEVDGRFYERRLRIGRWKRWLPEAGATFEGGFDKKHLHRRDPAYLQRYVVETRRAEVTHWVVMTCAPLFVLWNPLWLAAVMIVFGLLANLPCLVAQRYNRARLLRVLDRRARRGGLSPGGPGR